MIVLVTGGRTYVNFDRIYSVLSEIHEQTPISCVIHGGATGADEGAELWARRENVMTCVFRPDWQKRGKAAGPIRNAEMVRDGRPDLCVAFPGGAGTASCVACARKAGVEVREIDA